MTLLASFSLLVADTIRSRAYVQALGSAGYRVPHGMLIKSEENKWGQSSSLEKCAIPVGDMFLPDLSIPVEESLGSVCHNLTVSNVGTINAPEVISWLREYGASISIFSGFGGELVKTDLLNTGAKLLHMHAGWLPHYRGSTTVYYSLLDQRKAGVSAIFLEDKIDTGPILKRCLYDAPPKGLDIDYYYDSILRADTLLRVLADIEGDSIDSQRYVTQEENQGVSYYVIHPLLKHIALLCLAEVD